MKKTAIFILLLLLGTIEFLLGFVVAMHDYLAEFNTALQTQYDEANGKAKN